MKLVDVSRIKEVRRSSYDRPVHFQLLVEMCRSLGNLISEAK